MGVGEEMGDGLGLEEGIGDGLGDWVGSPVGVRVGVGLRLAEAVVAAAVIRMKARSADGRRLEETNVFVISSLDPHRLSAKNYLHQVFRGFLRPV